MAGELDRKAFFSRFASAVRRARQTAGAGVGANANANANANALAETERMGLLLDACALLPAEQHVALFREAYDKGDNAERCAVLRTLPKAPEPARFIEIAIESCRTNVVDVFRAIACDNAYPAQHFDELHWNQLVMKAFFLNVPVASILGLRERHNAELARMARDFAAERNAAGRPVPADLPLVSSSPA